MNTLEIKNKIDISWYEKEVYRTLRTNIGFTGMENQAIAVTSCDAQDGKSMVTLRLAYAMAEAGYATVLVDADMRKSILLNRLGVSRNINGLSHFLAGQAEAEDVIYTTNIPNFCLMPTGEFPINPTELLENKRFQTMISALKEDFQYIIIDTPPIGRVVDAAVIARQCDASVVVIPQDKISKMEAKRVVAQIRAANPNILGAVLSQVDSGKSGYYSKYYKKYYEEY